MRLNNLEVGEVERLAREVRSGAAEAWRRLSARVYWVISSGHPQMQGELSGEGMSMIVEAELPRFLGGRGSRPTPLHYFLYGLASSLLSTFVIIASRERVIINNAWMNVEAEVNYSRLLEVGEEPALQKIFLELGVESEAPRERVKELLEKAVDLCPALFSLRKETVVDVKLAEVKQSS